jgi:hypothetical protein
VLIVVVHTFRPFVLSPSFSLPLLLLQTFRPQKKFDEGTLRFELHKKASVRSLQKQREEKLDEKNREEEEAEGGSPPFCFQFQTKGLHRCLFTKRVASHSLSKTRKEKTEIKLERLKTRRSILCFVLRLF